MARQAKFDHGYDVRQEGDRRVIGFKGDGLPWSAWVVFPIAFLSVVWLLATPFWIVPAVLIPGTGYLIYQTFQRQEFTLTPDSILKGGVEYDLGRVSEVLIDNPLDKAVSVTATPGMVVGGTGIMVEKYDNDTDGARLRTSRSTMDYSLGSDQSLPWSSSLVRNPVRFKS